MARGSVEELEWDWDQLRRDVPEQFLDPNAVVVYDAMAAMHRSGRTEFSTEALCVRTRLPAHAVEKAFSVWVLLQVLERKHNRYVFVAPPD